jgi:hypothetical protein
MIEKTPQEKARIELARRELERRSQSKEEPNLLQKFIRRGLKDPAIGILNMGREFANLPNKLTRGYIPELSPSDYDFAEALGVENPDTTDKAIQLISQYAPSFAIPGVGLGRAGHAISKIPGAGRFISKAVSEAIPQAAYSAAQAPKDKALESGLETGATMAPFGVLSELMKGASPTMRTILKGGAAGLAGFGTREAAKGIGIGETPADLAAITAGAFASRGMRNSHDVMKYLTKGINEDLAKTKLEAAKRIGLQYLTPAEAGVNQTLAKRQGALGRTEEGSQLMYEKGVERQASERRAIENTLNKIYNPSMEPQIKEAYKSVADVNLPPDFPLQFKDNAIVKQAERLVKKTPAYQESLKEMLPENVKLNPGQTDVQPTSLVYWDHVKRAMDDMVEKAERSGNRNEARIISETRAKMRNQMDEHFPEYFKARKLYELKKTREGLEKVFDRKEITGSNFYQALASEKKFDELMTHLKHAPEAAHNLKDMRLVFKELLGTPTIKTVKGGEERGMFQHRNEGSFLESLFEHAFTGGKHEKEAIEFITSPDWNKKLKEINKISDKQLKLAAFATALTRGISQAAGQKERKPMELEVTEGRRK